MAAAYKTIVSAQRVIAAQYVLGNVHASELLTGVMRTCVPTKKRSIIAQPLIAFAGMFVDLNIIRTKPECLVRWEQTHPRHGGKPTRGFRSLFWAGIAERFTEPTGHV